MKQRRMTKQESELMAFQRQMAIRDGLKRYNPLVPCANGHMSPRRTKDNKCIQCKKEVQQRNSAYQKEYYHKNKAVLKERQKEYFAKPASWKTFHHQLLPVDYPKKGKKGLLLVACYFCRKHFTPTRHQVANRIQAIKGNYSAGDEHNLYCSDDCKDRCAAYKSRSNPDLKFDPSVLKMWADDVKGCAGFKCEICGSTDNLHAHHILPKSIEPKQAYDMDNGICLCRDCHFKYGHQDDCSPVALSQIGC